MESERSAEQATGAERLGVEPDTNGVLPCDGDAFRGPGEHTERVDMGR